MGTAAGFDGAPPFAALLIRNLLVLTLISLVARYAADPEQMETESIK